MSDRRSLSATMMIGLLPALFFLDACASNKQTIQSGESDPTSSTVHELVVLDQNGREVPQPKGDSLPKGDSEEQLLRSAAE